jgi:hypothetical protein
VAVHVLVEVSGCPTTCMHCWALGGDYGVMPLDDAAFVVDALAEFCGERDMEYTAYPMHEVVAHPAAPAVIRLFAPHLGGPYDPILTPGTPLASREDWEDVVAAAKDCGAHALWVAFHGYGREHDRQLNRAGAFEESCLAVRRAQDSGLGTGANVFLTKQGLADFDRLVSVLLELGVAQLSVAPAHYTPTSRGRRYETMRPELDDLLPLAGRVLEISDLAREKWSDVASYTEAAWRERALAGLWPVEHGGDETHHRLVCRRNLDVYTGTTGVYRTRHGNLRRDGAEVVLDRALAAGPVSDEQIYFGDVGGSDAAVAAASGEPASTRIHFEASSVRYRWLDRANGR